VHVIQGTVLPREKYAIQAFEIAPVSEVKRLRGFDHVNLSYTYASK